MSGCRISRVRMKSGGADVRVLHSIAAENGENWHSKLVQNARSIADTHNRIAGYAIIEMFADGTYRFANRLASDAPVPSMLWPSWLEEVARRELVTANEVRYVLEEEYIG